MICFEPTSSYRLPVAGRCELKIGVANASIRDLHTQNNIDKKKNKIPKKEITFYLR